MMKKLIIDNKIFKDKATKITNDKNSIGTLPNGKQVWVIKSVANIIQRVIKKGTPKSEEDLKKLFSACFNTSETIQFTKSNMENLKKYFNIN